MALIREETRPQVPRRKPPKVPVSRNKPARRTRRITYNVQAIQSLRDVVIPQRTPRQARAIENKAAIATAYNQNIESMLRFGRNYVTRMVAFNALPQVVASLTNRPLQAMITHGPPALQRAVLQAVGPWPGQGAARLVDTAIQAAVPRIAGLGLANYFLGGTERPANIPESRLSGISGFGGSAAQRQRAPQFPQWGTR